MLKKEHYFYLSGVNIELWAWRLRRQRIHLQCRRPGFHPWVRKITREGIGYPTPVFLGFPGGSKRKEYACNAGDLGSIHGLEKRMATHSGILACRIPWTEEPGKEFMPGSWGRKESDRTERLSLHFIIENNGDNVWKTLSKRKQVLYKNSLGV